MRAFLLPISYLLLTTFLFISCKEPTKVNIHRGFYYWRSSFQLTPKEQSTLQALSIQQLYVKFFDVEWNEESGEPNPVAMIRFGEQPSASSPITPVVFITNETLLQSDSLQINSLASNLTKLLSGIVANHQLSITNEIQIDCDWTTTTKDNYFQLLQRLRLQPFFQGKTLSATIRLHQLKFVSQTGIPPVDKGLLMCYNMGNLRHPATRNSIVDIAELDKYIGRLTYYPLQLDIALPLFDWYVWFSKNAYKGLIYPQQLGFQSSQEKITFTTDTLINGYGFKAGDWLRYESGNVEVLKEVAERLKNKLPQKDRTILLYHLDEQVLSKYQNNELKNLFDRFH